MIGWLLLGLVVGFAGGFAAAWYLLRRPTASGASMAPEPRIAEPLIGTDPTDEEMSQALDATRGLLDELEGRYRGRTAPPEKEPGEGEPKPKRRARGPRQKP